MKKLVISTALLVLFSTTLLGAVTSFADETTVKADTKAEITFTTDETEGGVVVDPDPENNEPEVITPEPGGSTTGALRIQYVPHLKFGVKSGITAEKVEQDVLVVPLMNGTTATEKAIPPFVQVTDNRGLTDEEYKKNKWTLSVMGTPFKNAANHELTGSHVLLKGSTLTVTNGDNAKAKTLASGQVGQQIPTSGSTPLVVLKSSETNNTNGYQVSNVFDDNYKKETNYVTGTRNNGVEFIKAQGVTPSKDVVYSSTLTWTLTSGL